MTVPTDPLYAQQWHFTSLGNGRGRGLLERVWNEFTGAGVHIGIYDDGIELAHQDLNGTHDASRDLVIGGTTYNGNTQNAAAHGTGVAGLMVAENNGVGTVGVSWGARYTSVNVFDPANPASINTDPAFLLPAIHWGENFDVTNNSWAFFAEYLNGQSLATPTNFVVQLLAEFAYSSGAGRGGLGTVSVNGAANDNTDANGLALNVSRHTLTVGAILETGVAARYSNYGACLLVTAPGGDLVIDYFGFNFDTEDGTRAIVSTDRTGAAGFNDATPDVNQGTPGSYTLTDSDYCDMWGGTSFSGPMVSGVVALMLDANPGIGWRDVQDLIARSAFHTGAAIGGAALANENGAWFVNEATDWNGGGMHFSIDYGFGAVDPFGAVRLAEAAGIIAAAAKTTANEATLTTGVRVLNAAIPDNTTSTHSFNIAGNLSIEHVDLSLDFDHTRYTDLRITLISPQGTEVEIYNGLASDPSTLGIGLDWMWGVEALRGESVAGLWRVRIADVVSGVAGLLKEARIDVYGSPTTPGDIYHFTDEFAQMRALDATRGTLSDTDGGVDWLNAAALSTNATLNLNPGQTSTIDGAALTIAAGSVIENAISGDGADALTGNAATNKLHGMRGNDALSAGAGNDFLDGGAGVDTLIGGLGDDILIVDNAADAITEAAGEGNDSVRASVSYALAAGRSIEDLRTTNTAGATAINLTGNEFASSIQGNAGANTLNGGGGIDTMFGFGGNDIYTVDNASDRAIEAVGGGVDRVTTSVSFVLEAGREVENLTTANSAAATSINLAGNAFSNTIQGNAGANALNGGGGIDTMFGFAGNDSYYVDNAGDRTIEAAGGGADRVLTSVSFALEAGREIEQLTTTGAGGTTALNLTGNAFNNVITGNAGANTLNGGGGIDTMFGLAGNDFYHVDNASDRAIEAAAGGADRVFTSVSFVLEAGREIEQLTTANAGLTAALNLTGNAFANTIVGNAGNNFINGGGGGDTLFGLGGLDNFMFTTALGASNVDAISGFVVTDDTIRVDNAVFGGLPATGVLPPGAFRIGPTALDADDRIIYNSASGALFHDADGVGGAAAIQFAAVSAGLAMTNSDFVVV